MKKIFFVFLTVLIIIIISDVTHAACINSSEANLRKGPGTNYEKTWEVFKYMPFKIISTEGNWYKVRDVDGDVHWIYKKLITKKYKCAVVKTDTANVRTGPGTGYGQNSFSPAQKYDSFKIVQTKSSWVKVVDEFGDRGWIFKNLLWIQ